MDHAKNSKVRLLRPNNQDNVIEQMLPSLVDYIQPNKTCEIDFQSRRSILWGHGYGAPKKNVMAQNFKSTNLVCLYWFICVFSLQHFNGFIGVYNSITLPKSFWLFLQNPSHLTPRLAPQYFSNYFGFFLLKSNYFGFAILYHNLREWKLLSVSKTARMDKNLEFQKQRSYQIIATHVGFHKQIELVIKSNSTTSLILSTP